jgi:hypothetical protein
MAEKTDTTAGVIAEIAAFGEFLPGSVRRTTEKRKSKRTGEVAVYEAQPIYTYTDPATGRQKSKRIPKEAFDRVKELTERGRAMRRLLSRFEAAAVAENLDDSSKKNSSR